MMAKNYRGPVGRMGAGTGERTYAVSGWPGREQGGSANVSGVTLATTTRPYLFRALSVLMLSGGSESSWLKLIMLIV